MSIKTSRDISAAAKEDGVGRNNTYQVKVCELEAALAEYDAIRAALEQVEYVAIGAEGMDGFSHCPWCEQFSDEPHANDCVRQSALKGEE